MTPEDVLADIQGWKALGYEIMIYTTDYVEGEFYRGWICAICPPRGGLTDHANRVYTADTDVRTAIHGALIKAADRWPEKARFID